MTTVLTIIGIAALVFGPPILFALWTLWQFYKASDEYREDHDL